MEKRLYQFNYNLEELIEYSQKVPDKNQEFWHEEIMTCFIDLFTDCIISRFQILQSQVGLDYFDSVLKAAELFHGSPLRKMRAEVLSRNCRQAIEDSDVNQAKTFALQAITELSYVIPADFWTLQSRADLYNMLSHLDKKKASYYSKLVIENLKTLANENLIYEDWKPY